MFINLINKYTYICKYTYSNKRYNTPHCLLGRTVDAKSQKRSAAIVYVPQNYFLGKYNKDIKFQILDYLLNVINVGNDVIRNAYVQRHVLIL